SSRRRHTRFSRDWSSDVCSSDLPNYLTKDELEQLNFIRRKENVILVGAPGTGKTHLASALGRKACEQGYEVRFYRVSHLVEELRSEERRVGKECRCRRAHSQAET